MASEQPETEPPLLCRGYLTSRDCIMNVGTDLGVDFRDRKLSDTSSIGPNDIYNWSHCSPRSIDMTRQSVPSPVFIKPSETEITSASSNLDIGPNLMDHGSKHTERFPAETSPQSCVPYDGRDYLPPRSQHPIYNLRSWYPSTPLPIDQLMISEPLRGSDGSKLAPIEAVQTGLECAKLNFRHEPRFGVYLGRQTIEGDLGSQCSEQTVCYEVKDTSRWIWEDVNRVLLLDREMLGGNRYVWE